MHSTSRWGLEYPDSPDLQNAYPGVGASLAQALDGGTRGGVAASVPMFQLGATASMPAASTGAGLMYLATDALPPVLYVSDGTNWQPITTGGSVPVGGISQYIGTSDPAPLGGKTWVIADGRPLSAASYSVLFATIGYTYGGTGGNFNIPNLQGRALIGAGTGAANNDGTGTTPSARTLGKLQGEDAHTLASSELAAHSHAITDPSHNHTVHDPGHGHGITDPGHGHGVTDGGHAHGVYDPGHNHYVNDPGHAHGGYVSAATADGSGRWAPISNGNGWGDLSAAGGSLHYAAGSGGQDVGGSNLNHAHGLGIYGSGTGIWLNGSGTNIGIYSSGTGVTVNGGSTGVTVNGSSTGVYNNSSPTGITVNNSTGGGGSHNNVQPSAVVNHIIRIA